MLALQLYHLRCSENILKQYCPTFKMYRMRFTFEYHMIHVKITAVYK